jgi:hypothetical protein
VTKYFENPGVVAALLTIAVVALLSGCWDAPFDNGDDPVTMLWASEHPVGELLTKPFEVFPVTLLSFKVDYALFGPPGSMAPRAALADRVQSRVWSAGCRLVNGFYCILAGLALWYFIRKLSGDAFLGAAVAVAWLVHPMSCESVCWVVERKNVLAALFGFLALIFWIEDRLGFWHWPLVWLCYCLAVFSKASALGMLPVFVLLDIFFPREQSTGHGRRGWITTVERLIVPGLISVGGVLFTMSGFRYSEVPPPGGSIFTALLTDVEIFSRYIHHILAPVKLSFYYYVEPILSPADPRLWIYGATTAALLAALVWISKPQMRLALFGVLWFFAALGPNANLMAGAFTMQDRFVFLSAPGILLALFLAIKHGAARFSAQPSAAWVASGAFVLLLTIAALAKSSKYADPGTLAIEAAQSQPLSAFAQLSAGKAHTVLAQSLLSINNVNAQMDARQSAQDALENLDHAIQCSEFRYFENPLELQVLRAQNLLVLQEFSKVRETLKGFLPPEHLTALPEAGPLARSQLHTGYQKQTLVQAWKVAANSALAESNGATLPTERRIELRKEALQDLEEAEKLQNKTDNELVFLKAGVLLNLAQIDKPVEVQREHYDAGAQLLKGLENSPRGEAAKRLLASQKRP